VVGRQYQVRLAAIQQAEIVRELYGHQGLDFHPLTGNRSGQFAVRLTGQMRLILTVEDDQTVWVEEVTDYHG
jgi:plasmid maintenance system killer protein